MGGGILTFNATLAEVIAGKRKLMHFARCSTENQTLSRQMNQFYQFRTYNEIDEIHPEHYFHDDGVTGGPLGRNGREEYHRMIRTLRKHSRSKFMIWVSDLQRFRDFAMFVAFWDEFLRDNDRVVLYIDDEQSLISSFMTRQQQSFMMVMSWQAENYIHDQKKKTVNGIKAYRDNNPDKHWGRPVDQEKDVTLTRLYQNQLLNGGKPNLSELSRALGKSRAKIRDDIERLGLNFDVAN